MFNHITTWINIMEIISKEVFQELLIFFSLYFSAKD